jgi:hypothetical protein
VLCSQVILTNDPWSTEFWACRPVKSSNRRGAIGSGTVAFE